MGAGPSWSETEPPEPLHIDLPQLKYSGDWSPRGDVMTVLARELRLRTRLEPDRAPSTVEPSSEALFDTPFLYVAGSGALPAFDPKVETALRRFVDLGGFIFFDAADGGADRAFSDSVEDLLARMMPGTLLAPVSSDHVIYRSFYIVDAPWGRTQNVEHLLGIQDDGRLKTILIRNDLGGALAETPSGLAAHPCTPGGAMQREWAIRFGVNILLYATCTDYKADRAHVETLLRSRRWR